jgi:hypothetical protein
MSQLALHAYDLSAERVWLNEFAMPTTHHLRSIPRHTFHANVRALPLDGRLSPASGITEDISSKGIFINSTHQPAANSLMVLRIYALGGPLSLLARVAHRREGVGYGCEFIDLHQPTRRRLDGLAGSPPPPSRC